MKYDAVALDFLLPGAMSLAQVQSRRVIFDKSYDLEVPVAPNNDSLDQVSADFWESIEADIKTAKVGNFQTVELTACFVRSVRSECSGEEGFEVTILPVVTTYRRLYLPIIHKCWPEFEPFSNADEDHKPPDYIYNNTIDIGRLKRVIIRLQPDLNMPVYWTKRPRLDFPLLEIGFVPPQATLPENMEAATRSKASVKSDKFTADDAELLKKELDPTSRVLLKPKEYTEEVEDDGVTSEQLACGKIKSKIKPYQLTSVIADKIPDVSRVARIIEIIADDCERSIVRFDYPLVANHDVLLPTYKFTKYDNVSERTFFVYQDDNSIDLLERIFGDGNHIS